MWLGSNRSAHLSRRSALLVALSALLVAATYLVDPCRRCLVASALATPTDLLRTGSPCRAGTMVTLRRLEVRIQVFRAREGRLPGTLDEVIGEAECAPFDGVLVWVLLSDEQGALVDLGPDRAIGATCPCLSGDDAVLWAGAVSDAEHLRQPWTPSHSIDLPPDVRRSTVNRALQSPR